MSQSRLSSAEISEWSKIKILLWKNWSIQWNNRVHLLFSIITPSLFLITVVFMRFFVSIENFPATHFNAVNLTESWKELIAELEERQKSVRRSVFDFNYNTFIPRPVIAYAPGNYEAFKTIMQSALSDLPNVSLQVFETCKALRARMRTEYYLAGACFDPSILDLAVETESRHLRNGFPNRLNFTIVFPSELRIYNDSFISAHWNTNTLFDNMHEFIARFGSGDKGGYVGYIREGFLSLQNAITMSYIRHITNRTDIPKIYVRRFPQRKRDYDPLSDNIDICLSMIIMTGYLYPITRLIQSIMYEKEKQLKPVLQCIGIRNRTHVFAWFINGLASMSVSSLLQLIILKIHWHEGYAILNQSSWLAVLIFLISYNLATVCFCLMMSSFFKRTATATSATMLLWFAMYLPYASTAQSYNVTVKLMLMTFLFSNTAMGFAIDNILQFETLGNGFQLSNFFDEDGSENKFSVGACVCILCALSFIYAAVSLGVESSRVYFVNVGTLRKAFQSARSSMASAERPSGASEEPRKSSNTTSYRMTKVYEIEPSYKKCSVEIKNLTKEYDGRNVVNDVVINLYENDITVLMGHNGSGKTTLVSMVLGLLSPTKGTAIINGYDIFLNPADVRSSLGICFSDLLIYEELTVANQLMFFSLIKGMSKSDAENEVEKFLSAMNLMAQRDELSKNLSDGLKQNLAVCCALTGKSKFVVLDQPSFKMDIEGRKLFWKLLHVEKFGRTILMTTHSSIEAENLSDRIAILSGGELKCTGTASFLHNVYGHGYRLDCCISPFSNPDAITKTLQKYIPRITPDCTIGNVLSYTLAEHYADTVNALLTDLENSRNELSIESISINAFDIEDIFFKLGAENPGEDDRNRYAEISNGISAYARDYELLQYVEDYEPVKGWQLRFNQWYAVLLKRFIHNVRQKPLLIAQMIVPFVFTSLSFMMPYIDIDHLHLEPIAFGLRQYDETVSLVETRSSANPTIRSIEGKYRQMIFWLGFEHRIMETKGEPLIPYIIQLQEQHQYALNWRFMTAVTFGSDYITAWFNNYPLHTAPLSLNLVHNAILRDLVDNNARVMTTLHPLPVINQDATLSRTTANLGSYMAINLSFCICFCWCQVILYLVRERQSRFKLMQYISGIRASNFLLASFCYDFCQVLATVVVVMLTIAAFQHKAFTQLYVLGWYCFVLIMSGVSLYSFNYFLALFFSDPINAHSVSVVVNAFGCASYYTMLNVLTSGYNQEFVIDESYGWFFRLFPNFSLYSALIKIFNHNEFERVCENEEVLIISNALDKCQALPKCCKPREVLDWEEGILIDLLWLAATTLVCWLMMFVIEHRNATSLHIPDDNYASAQKEHEDRHRSNDEPPVPDEIAAEIIKVNTMKPHEYHQTPLVCEHVGKLYKDSVAIERFTLVVNRSEWVGIIGHNGAGKSTLIKVLVNEEQMSYGRVYVNALRLKDELFKVYEHIGYSPQESGVLPEYTGEEFLTIIGLLRGIPSGEIRSRYEMLTKVLGVYSHTYKTFNITTDGNQRRIVCAAAMLGNISILYLDQPAMSIDPAGRRQLWNVLNIMRRRGVAVMSTSSNLHECQRYSNKLVLLTNGRIESIGVPYHIGREVSNDILLYIKLRAASVDEKKSRRTFLMLCSFVEEEFQSASIKDSYCSTMVFQIPANINSVAHIFEKVHDNAFNLNIDNFIITTDKQDIEFQ